MSASGIYPALSGAMAESHALDVISNNLANTATGAFRGERLGFKEVLSQAPGSRNRPEHHFVQVARQQSDTTPGPMRSTGQATDLALSGPGFLAVMTPRGERYVRGGAMTRGADGHLLNQSGYVVLGKDHKPIAIPPGGALHFGEQGEVYVNEKKVADLALVEFQSPKALRSEGGDVYGGGAAPQPASETTVQSAFLEGANVSPMRAMTEVIVTSRHYDALHRVIETFKEVDTTAAHDLASVV